ncbi:hypothetical protein EDB97_11677 [Agrobacterium tumefaciens]|nr:hypothetical protein EDB97_11677 [Agrobacterium tumefaciens]
MSGTATKTATKGATKHSAPAASPHSSIKPVIQATAPTREDDSDDESCDEEVTEEKPFSDLSQAERDEIHKKRADELTTDPIYQIRFAPYRALAENNGAVKISEAPDCHFYQFEGEKDEEFFVWAFVRFGLPVKREEVEKSDRRAKRRALREEAKKAGIYKDILQELRKETSVRPAKGAARKKATSPAAWRRNNHGVANGTWQSNNYGAPVRPWLFNNYDAPTGGRRYGHF